MQDTSLGVTRTIAIENIPYFYCSVDHIRKIALIVLGLYTIFTIFSLLLNFKILKSAMAGRVNETSTFVKQYRNSTNMETWN